MALPVSFHFERSPHEDAACLGAALDWVQLAEHRSYKTRFSMMGEVQTRDPLFKDDF